MITISTWPQARFHLENGEVIQFQLSKNEAGMLIKRGDTFTCIIQPQFESNSIYETTAPEEVAKLIQILLKKHPVYMIPGNRIITIKPGFFHRILIWLHGLKKKFLSFLS